MANAASGYVVPLAPVSRAASGAGLRQPQLPGLAERRLRHLRPEREPRSAGPKRVVDRRVERAAPRLRHGGRARHPRHGRERGDASLRGRPEQRRCRRLGRALEAVERDRCRRPDGVTLMSPMHMTGLRVSRDYGAERDPLRRCGRPVARRCSAGLGIRSNLNQDQWLDPMNAMQGLRNFNASSPYAQPNAGDYLSTMQSATGGPGAADYYGQRGVDQTNALADTNIRQLNRNIDREMELSLGNQLPEISRGDGGRGPRPLGRGTAPDAAGVERGARTGDQGQEPDDGGLHRPRGEPSRVGDQPRLADRRAGYGQYSQQMGQAALAGLGDEFQMNQANRQNEQALFSQQMQNRYAKNQNDQSALFDLLGRSGAYNQNALQMENAGQSSALRDWLMLQQNRDQSQASSLDRALKLGNAQRQIQQDRLNQMIAAGMQPWETQLRIATGTTAPSGNYSQPRSFWDSNRAARGGERRCQLDHGRRGAECRLAGIRLHARLGVVRIRLANTDDVPRLNALAIAYSLETEQHGTERNERLLCELLLYGIRAGEAVVVAEQDGDWSASARGCICRTRLQRRWRARHLRRAPARRDHVSCALRKFAEEHAVRLGYRYVDGIAAPKTRQVWNQSCAAASGWSASTCVVTSNSNARDESRGAAAVEGLLIENDKTQLPELL